MQGSSDCTENLYLIHQKKMYRNRSMVKKFFNALFLLSLVIYLGCNTNPLRDAIDDFALIIELEPIQTGLSIAVHDYETKELITDNVSIYFHEESSEYTIDIFGDRVDSVNLEGGIYNVGFVDEITPNSENTHPVSFTVQSDGYISKNFHISLSDTGVTHLNIDLFSRENAPSNYQVSTITAPIDSAGNPLPLPFPFDSSGADQSQGKLKSFTDQNVFTNPVLYTLNKPDSLYWIERTSEGIKTLEGYPTAYQAVSYAWSPNPDFAEPYFPGPLYAGLYRTLYKLESFEMIGEEAEFSTTWLVHYNGRKVYPLTFMFFNNIPSFGNAVNWISDIKKTSVSGSMKATSTFYNSNIFSTGTEKLWDVNFLEKVTFTNWFSNAATFSENAPALYSIYQNLSDTSEFVQQYFVVQQNMLAEGGSGNTMFGFFEKPYYVYDAVRTGDVNLTIAGYADGLAPSRKSSFSIEILSEGYRRTGSQPIQGFGSNGTTIHNVPMSFANITIGLPESYYETTLDLSNYNGEQILINVPPPTANLVDATITANLRCADPTKSVRWSFIPNSSLRYRDVGIPINYNYSGSIKWNYDSSIQKVDSVELGLTAVETGGTYKLFITVLGTTQTTSVTISNSSSQPDPTLRPIVNQSIDFTMDAKYCS